MGRMVLPNYPPHIVQRGHNRQVVFACADADDFQRYLTDIRELKVQFGIKLYAWCLMKNHVHLLARWRAKLASTSYDRIGRHV